MRTRLREGALLAALLAAHAQGPFNAATYNLRLNTPSEAANAWPHRKQVVLDLLEFHELGPASAALSRVPTLS